MPPKERPSPDYHRGYSYPCNVYGHVRQLEASIRDETLVKLICQGEKDPMAKEVLKGLPLDFNKQWLSEG